jgi:drug/metabolite transporter (DMT)-like permease
MQTFALTALAMLAFAANSLLTRLGVAGEGMDAGLFAVVRVASGAVVLWALVQRRGRPVPLGWHRVRPAAMLALYMAGFSAAYQSLDAGVGALILFGGVQVTMFVGALLAGERMTLPKVLGAAVALTGLAVLVWPGPGFALPLPGVALMLAAALGWGVYSLLGRSEVDPLAGTAANFALCLPMVLPMVLIGEGAASLPGIVLACVAGGLTSGLGYALWYLVLPRLAATRAAVAQLSVPVLAAAGGVVVLGEALEWRFALAALLVLAGIGLTLWRRA